MKYFFKFIIIIILLTIINCDWVKISQDPIRNVGTELSSTFNNKYHLSSILDKEHKIEKSPSQEWLDYQKLRFSFSDNIQKIIVSENSNLKNSAQVISVDNKTLIAEKSNNNNTSQNPNIIQELRFQKRLEKDDNFDSQEKVNIQVNKNVKSDKIIDDERKLSKLKQNKQNGKEIRSENTKIKSPSFSGFLEFLKSMQSKIISNTAKSVNDKINKLVELRDKLLLNIEDRIMSLWPKKPIKRSKRGLFDDSHNNFISSETALMTINFLTFAVFLIKLVLQVIKTIKSKHYNFNGFAVNSLEAIKLANSRKNARHFGDSEDDIEKTEKILSLIEKFNN